MAKSKKVEGNWSALRLKGKTFVIAGRDSQGLGQRIEREGGTVTEKVSAKSSYVLSVATRGTPAAVKEALKLNKKGASIQIIDVPAFDAMFAVSAEEARAMLAAGKHGLKRFNELLYYDNPQASVIDLSGSNFRGLQSPENVSLGRVKLDGADFGEANLRKSSLGELKGARLDKAILSGGSGAFTDCSLIDADLTEAYVQIFHRCNLTRADLSRAHAWGATFEDCIFSGAKFKNASLSHASFKSCDLTGVDFSGAELREADFKGARLGDAHLTGADLTDAKFAKADLTGADFRNAELAGANFTDAVIDGADFTGAQVVGATFGNADLGKARGLHIDTTPLAQPGPRVSELTDIARQSASIFFHADIDVPEGCVAVDIVTSQVSKAMRHSASASYELFTTSGTTTVPGAGVTVAECIFRACNKWRHGTLRLDEFKVKAKGCPLAPNALLELVIDAWCEAMGSDRATLAVAQEAALTRHREQWLARWRDEAAGVQAWNKTNSIDRWRAGSFAGVQLAGATLDNLVCLQLILEGADFTGASLKNANFDTCEGKKAIFAGADLTHATFDHSKMNAADFSGATLVKADLCASIFANANFQNANLKNARMTCADLKGTDFTGATLTGAELDYSEYDEKTRWPEGFRLPSGLKWKGKGAAPIVYRAKKAAKAKASSNDPAALTPVNPRAAMDFETFTSKLIGKVNYSKLSKATSMLKADRFQLFADVTDRYIDGVVKSQTDADLVYSCRLLCNGSYACCTQNLNVCGGLRGGICKHLLVLLIGLAKSGKLDPAIADAWVGASRYRNPELDKNVMGEILLKYKGAEAGEVDWRPTETVPEDYYAL